ncbi:polyprenyl diphosphate synthase [Bacteriovoracales bacterium]|nr:polyprenyl diphosphate synthase [Bacteriovoracales bacterium]
MLENSENNSLNHVAIIMDGNGRWAQSRSHSRIWGHIRGVKVVSDIVEEADNCGIRALTLYAFSTENWSRPFIEVKTLFTLLKKFLIKEKERILKNRIRFRIIGDITSLPSSTLKLVKELEGITKDFEGLKLTFAFSYGSRAEIVNSVNKYISQNPGAPLSEEKLGKLLFNADSGDVDLLIRTGGDFRVSNFLLWQLAYAELFFTPTQWPEFSREEFKKIFINVSSRQRRFGGVKESSSLLENTSIAKRNKAVLEESLRF